jgi:multidrug efflux pump subunit AcrB
MSALGETINIMTLGGLALAVGILVDDATVEIENINRLLPEGKSLRDTILTGAQQIATPAFVATLSICIVFVPIFFLKGVPGFLFRPLAEAVVFAMLASYFLSRTIVPTLVMYFFLAERRRDVRRDAARAAGEHKPGVFHRFHVGFEKRFERVRDGYVEKLECLSHRLVFGLFWRSAPLRCSCCRCWAPISSPPWMRGRFAFTFARRLARASRRRRRSATGWSNRCAGRSPRATSPG